MHVMTLTADGPNVVWCRSRVVNVADGPMLLDRLADGPGLAAHRRAYGSLPDLQRQALLDLIEAADMRGRGGTGKPIARMLRTVPSGRSTEVIVNAAEPDPLSVKDSALLMAAPHKVLDGAAIMANAMGARHVHVVLGHGRADLSAAVSRAFAQRNAQGEDLEWTLHHAPPGVVGGHPSAIVDLVGGRTTLPDTTLAPSRIKGLKGRPTVVSAAETFAQVFALIQLGVAAYQAVGITAAGTVLLTVTRSSGSTVLEVPTGTPWSEVLTIEDLAGSVLVGGVHGTWVHQGSLSRAVVDPSLLAAEGIVLGPAAIWTTPDRVCPIGITSQMLEWQAICAVDQCRSCAHNLPHVSDAFTAAARERQPEQVLALAELLNSAEAEQLCPHIPGLARLVRSAMSELDTAWQTHLMNACDCYNVDRSW